MIDAIPVLATTIHGILFSRAKSISTLSSIVLPSNMIIVFFKIFIVNIMIIFFIIIIIKYFKYNYNIKRYLFRLLHQYETVHPSLTLSSHSEDQIVFVATH